MEQLRVLIARVSWDSGVGSALALTFFFINTPEASHIVCASSIPQEFATPLLKGGIAAVYRQVIQHVVGVAHDRMQVRDHRQESPQLVATSPFSADQTLPRHDFSQCSYQRVLPVSVRPLCAGLLRLQSQQKHVTENFAGAASGPDGNGRPGTFMPWHIQDTGLGVGVQRSRAVQVFGFKGSGFKTQGSVRV